MPVEGWITEKELPDGVAFITSDSEVVGLWLEPDLTLTEEEEAIIDKALTDRGLPPLSKAPRN